MINESRIAEILKGPDENVLSDLERCLPNLTLTEKFDLLTLIEDNEIFRLRLPLRLETYALLAQNTSDKNLALIAYLRLLRRLGARRDIPNLGEIPTDSTDFATHLSQMAGKLSDDEYLTEAVESLALATNAFRSGDLGSMEHISLRGLEAVMRIDSWLNPPEIPDLKDLAVCETGHELYFLATNALFRKGDVSHAQKIAMEWSDLIEKWEKILGSLPRQRYQYFQIVGHLNYETGVYEAAIGSYKKALEYAPTAYRKSFLWLSLARIERNLGKLDECWEHTSNAITAILESPYPQMAAAWIEWLALDAYSPSKLAQIKSMRDKLGKAGGIEINRVTAAMTRLYRLLGSLKHGTDPSEIGPVLDKLISELEGLESWPNLITILATRAVVFGRMNDRDGMEKSIDHARELLSTKVAPDARPPIEFFLENANALALRDIGDYDEAFSALFERALQARMQYPGGMGPDEQTTVEALYYLGALSGNDPETIEKKIRDTIKNRVN
ncbi:MAG: hypothetical protein NTY09_05385 [bacterium]|nr:hypothetical protein [bacterium]